MDVPISLAVLLAGGMSLFETIQGGRYVYFDSAVALLFFLLLGRYLDCRARGSRPGGGRTAAGVDGQLRDGLASRRPAFGADAGPAAAGDAAFWPPPANGLPPTAA